MTENKPTAKPATEKKPESSARGIFIAFLFATIGVASVIITIELSNRGSFPFVTSQRNHLIAAELAVFSIFFVEIIGRLANKHLERDALRRGMSARVIIRTAGYLVVGVAVISILASNSALAISIGTITGVVIGFATQNLLQQYAGRDNPGYQPCGARRRRDNLHGKHRPRRRDPSPLHRYRLRRQPGLHTQLGYADQRRPAQKRPGRGIVSGPCKTKSN